ncbi:TfoX/Sxy family protein [Candidatus Saccharibacteria bacterium]|nr:TfoX/Sxy family protein [Candidatus Saccharibacteria bacterium]
MAYDLILESRIDDEIASWHVEVMKRKMFGGLGYFIHGNMAFGVAGDELIVKPNPEQAEKLQQEPGMKPFEFGGRTMKSWCLAEPDILDEHNLPRLLEICCEYVLTLPPK